MKGVQYFRRAYVTIPLLFLLVISPAVILTSVDAAPSASACTSAVLTQKASEMAPPVTEQSARNLVEGSSQYLNAIKGYTTSFSGAGTEWNENPVSCTVSWSNFDMHYVLIAANGSAYELTIAANPATQTISTVMIKPMTAASFVSESSSTYSGYEVAANYNHSTHVEYSTDYWFVPTVSGTSSVCGSRCELAVWTGIQNSTYLGENRLPSSGSGEVIQGGTFSYVLCSGGSCTTGGGEDYAWGEFVFGNQNGVQRMVEDDCSMTVTPSDELYEEVGSGYEFNGSSSSTFHVLINDFTHDHICQPFGGGLTYSSQCTIIATSQQGNCEVSGTEYFADYILETPQVGSGAYPLPQFSVPGEDLFDILGMLSTAQGTWTYYNDGYYQYCWMENSNTNNTSVTPIYENSGGSTYGYFNETWLSSSGT